MHFYDAKVGDRIIVYISSATGGVVWRPTSECRLIPATVLEHTGGATILGWKSGENVPVYPALYERAVILEWMKQGIVLAVAYNSDCVCEPFMERAVQSKTEDNCKQCGKMNDMGVLQC